MPFTFSHPAIAVPLKKLKPNWFSSSGLVIGSMAPDFPYFLKMNTGSDFGHTLAGIFLLDLPLSFLVAVAFHLWVRDALILHLPSPLDRKWADCLGFDFMGYLKRAWPAFAVSAFVGTLTHLLWDIFTSPDGWVFYLDPAFFSREVQYGPVHLPLYRLIERAGSVLGLSFMVWLLFKKPTSAAKAFSSPVGKLRYWGGVMIGTVAVALLILWMKGTSGGMVYYIIVTISAAAVSICLNSVLSVMPKAWRTKT
ncbi:DUF4184 family protein [Pontibacter pamirensis]|uniref:DUF4184 family protein n=1 Tax=Pontibacter pamirensis TaxID=2562824 RepID=UPI001389746C|nr:DUF4184 family protein [Pontibacter pamirensis]